MNQKILKGVLASKKISLIGLICMLWSCQQDTPEEITLESVAVVTPYSVEIMRQAKDALMDDPSFNSEGIDVKENYQYIRFHKSLDISVEELSESIDFYDYPVLSRPGSASHESDGSLYAIIPSDESLPTSAYTILSSLYMPDHLADVEERQNDLALLEDKAFETVAWEEVEDTAPDQRVQDLKWVPRGKVFARNPDGSTYPVPQLKVEWRKNIAPNRWNTTVTDPSGNFKWDGPRPRIRVHYRIRFEIERNSLPAGFGLAPPILTPHIFMKASGLLQIGKGPTKSEYKPLIGDDNTTTDKTAELFFYTLKNYTEFRRKIEEEINTEAWGLWAQTLQRLTTECHNGPSTLEIFDYNNNKLKISLKSIDSYTPLDQALFVFGLTKGFEYHRLSNSGVKRLDDELIEIISLAVAYESMKNSRYSDMLPQINDYLLAQPETRNNSIIFDLMDSQEDPHPIGIEGLVDQVAGFTWRDVLTSLKGVYTIEEWRNKLMEDYPDQHGAISVLFAGELKGLVWFLFSGNGDQWKIINYSGSKAADLKVGDFDGDNKDDIIASAQSKYSIWYAGEGDSQPTPFRSTEDLFIGDINGDGKSDILREHISYHSGYLAPNFATSSTGQMTFTSYPKYYQGGDFNGDGKTDILYRLSRDYYGFKRGWLFSNGCLNDWEQRKELSAEIVDQGFLIGDFDANGKDDVFTSLINGPNGPGWYVSNMGSGPLNKISSFSNKVTNDLLVGDFNGDGEADIFTYLDVAEGSQGRGWYVSYGGKQSWQLLVVLSDLNFVEDGIDFIKLGDFDGDGITDILYTANSQ